MALDLKTLKNLDLMEEYTDALLHDDKKASYIYANSKYAKELLEKGKKVIPEIGRYLKTKMADIKKCTTEEKDTIEEGWILLLCNIVKKEKIDTGPVVFGYNFEKWVEWAISYSPD